jgi:hypothetical protein
MEAERAELDRHWKLRLERAQQDAARAFRQYDAVEPENRLVARTLERSWEEALRNVRTLQEDYNRLQASSPTTLSKAERQSILELSRNLPELWNSSSTTVADKRRIVQLLIEKAVVTDSQHERVDVELHWVGGTVTRHQVTRSVRRWSDLSTYREILSHVEEMVSRGARSGEIADSLNARRFRTCRGNEFTAENVRQLRARQAKTQAAE